MDRVLVVGARSGSLGSAIATRLRANGYVPVTAGQTDEDIALDLVDPYVSIPNAVGETEWRHIIYCAGVNPPARVGSISSDPLRNEPWEVNVIGAIGVLESWLDLVADMDWSLSLRNHFVCISSNSANIARTGSTLYCASKAAASMAIRCVGRELAKSGIHSPSVYAYEPGWIEDTPMSRNLRNRFGHSAEMHRIPGGNGINKNELAELIVRNLSLNGGMMNGTTIRLDGGEQ